MALYCYMISLYAYSDSEFIPIFHEQKYSKDEFDNICQEIHKKIWTGKFHWNYINDFVKMAIEEYGFKRINILEYDCNNSKVDGYYLSG